MYYNCATILIYTILVTYCDISDGQFLGLRDASTTPKPLPFPACRADNIQCLRRGLRTFFFLMDSGYLGMKPVDPMILNSVSISFPEEQMSFLLRNVNVSGSRWTKLAERQFDLPGGRAGVRFISDLHVTADISMAVSSRLDPYVARMTMDISEVESNITYIWSGEQGLDNEFYILIGQDRIVVRNSRTPTFFLEPDSEDSLILEQTLRLKPTFLEYISNEITVAVMQTIVNNFRHFGRSVPAKNYYLLYSN